MTGVTITMTPGSAVPGCENLVKGCFTPSPATVEIGEIVTIINADTAAHTFTAGTFEEGPTGEFGQGSGNLLPGGQDASWLANVVREIPYFCMVHPWSNGVLIVKPKSTKKDTVELGIQTENTSKLKM